MKKFDNLGLNITSTSEEIISENYIKLALSILSESDGIGVSLAGLYNFEEGRKRIEEIEEMRKKGIKTECELISCSEYNADDFIKQPLKKPRTPFTDIEKAFLLQVHPHLTFKEIGEILGRKPHCLNNWKSKIKYEGTTEFYKRLDVSDIFRKEKDNN